MGNLWRCAGWTEADASPKARAKANGNSAEGPWTTFTTEMICDTTFLSDLLRERLDGRPRGAQAFLAAHRTQPFLTTVISIGETAAMFANSEEVRPLLSRYRQLRLTPEIAFAAAAVDRELIRLGRRLGENDNWIAGFCRYYGQPIVSRDGGFDRVLRLRRLAY